MVQNSFFKFSTATVIIAFAAGLAPDTMAAFAQDQSDEARLATVVTTALATLTTIVTTGSLGFEGKVGLFDRSCLLGSYWCNLGRSS